MRRWSPRIGFVAALALVLLGAAACDTPECKPGNLCVYAESSAVGQSTFGNGSFTDWAPGDRDFEGADWGNLIYERAVRGQWTMHRSADHIVNRTGRALRLYLQLDDGRLFETCLPGSVERFDLAKVFMFFEFLSNTLVGHDLVARCPD
jgi:hypothetical protein